MKYQVQVDVTMTGEIYIEAENEHEAEQKAKEKYFDSYDIRGFRFLGVDVVDVEKEEY